MLHGTILNDDVLHCVAMLEQSCNHSKQCRNNVRMMSCVKIVVSNRPVEHHLNKIYNELVAH